MTHVTTRKTYAFTFQKYRFHCPKTMVSPLKTYVFTTQNLCFFQQTSDFFVIENSVFGVINCLSANCRNYLETRVFLAQLIVCAQCRSYESPKLGFSMTISYTRVARFRAFHRIWICCQRNRQCILISSTRGSK